MGNRRDNELSSYVHADLLLDVLVLQGKRELLSPKCVSKKLDRTHSFAEANN